MKKLITRFTAILSLSLLSACSPGSLEIREKNNNIVAQKVAVDNLVENDSKSKLNLKSSKDIQYKNEISAYKENLETYIQQKTNDFEGKYPYKIDVSVLTLDIENNELLGTYGDIDKYIVADNIFKPISVAILLNEYNISLDTQFPNKKYVLKNGTSISSYKDENMYNQNYSFIEGFSDYNNSMYFHALKNQDLNPFYDALKKLNLSKLDIKYDNGFDEVSTEILGNKLNISSKELALIYASFANGGKLFDDIDSSKYNQIFKQETGPQVLILLNSMLKKSSNDYNLLKNISSKYNISGMFSLQSVSENQKELSTWFAGVYPAENPKLITVINVSYEINEKLNENFDNRVHTEDLAPVAYDIMNYSLDNYIKKNDYFTHVRDLNFFEKNNLENNTKFIYFGRDTCSKCVLIEPEIQELIQKNNGELEIFYFNTDYFRGANNVQEIYDKYDIKSVPYMLKLNNGKVADYIDFSNSDDLKHDKSIFEKFIQ